MSIKIMSRVWESGPDNQGELLVLLALADFADDAGNCWPSMASIAVKARVQERSAVRIVRRLEASGYLETVIGGGRHGCNQYRINPDPVSPLTESHPDPECMKTLTRGSPEPSLEPSLINRGEAHEAFEAFWAAYPRKVGKGAARKAYDKAMRKADHQAVMHGLSKQIPVLSQKDKQFIPHASTWLNEERWTDEPERLGNSFGRGQVVSGPFASGRGRGGGIAAAVARRQLGGTS